MIIIAQYDVYHIEERLKDWNPAILRIEWKENQKAHKIICKDALDREYIGMSVPHGQLDVRVIDRMMEINPERGYNPFKEIDRMLNERDRKENSRIEQIAADFADNFRRPLIEDYFY